MSTFVRVVSLFYAAILLFATTTHVSHLLEHGLFPYSGLTGAHWSLNVYWTVLTIFNPILAIFILFRPLVGIHLFALHMIVNVSANALALTLCENLLVGKAGVLRQFIVALVAIVISAWLAGATWARQRTA